MRDVTVVITAAGGAGAPGIVHSLHHNGERVVRVVATDTDPLAVGLHLADAGHVVPRADASDYVDALLNVCRRERAVLVLPGLTEELYRLSQARETFAAEGIRVAAPDPATLARMDNKALLYETLAGQGIAVAPWRRVESIDELAAAAAALGYPKRRVALKRQVGSGGRGFSVLAADAHPDPEARDRLPFPCWRLEDALRHYEARGEFAPLVAMAWLGGLEYSVDLLLRPRGDVVYCLPRTREQVRLGTSVVAQLVDEPEAIELCRRIAACFDYGGNCNIQLKRDDAGRLWPSEINPRLSGTVVFCTRAGVNLPYFGVKYHLGEPIPRVEPAWGAVMIRHFTEVVLDRRPAPPR